MARKFIIRQNLSKMNNNLEKKRDSLTTCESKSTDNFGILNKLHNWTIKECVWFLRVSVQVFFRSGHCATATTRHPRPTDPWANESTLWTQLKTARKSHAQWSFLVSVQCPANRILSFLSAQQNRYRIVHLWSNTATHQERVLATARSAGPTPQTQQNFLQTQSKSLAILWDAEWFLNFSPASRDDPFKTGLRHIVRMGKRTKAINHDLSVLGRQAFGLLSIYQFSTSAWQSTCLKTQAPPGHLALTSTGSAHRWHHRCNSINERHMCSTVQ